MNSTVKFLGEEFTFSDDIKEYMAVSDIAEHIHNAMINSFVSKLNRKDASFIDTKSMLGDIRTQTEKFIKRLCKNEIYSETVDSMLSSNAGYEAIDSVNKAAAEAFCSFLAEEMSAFKSGMEAAELDAMSQITGSGVTVFSSSMLTLAATSAMECAIVKDQINKADAQYKRNIQNISDSGERARIAKETQYVKSTYIPQMDKAIWLFAYSLMDKYLNEMISAGKFDATALDNVDYKKARGILDNLKHIKDSAAKISCIKQAFLACPYNIDVYLSAITTDKFDSETYKAAEYFGVHTDLVAQIKQNLTITKVARLSNTIKRKEQYIYAYSLCTNRDRISVLKELTAQLYAAVLQQYNDLQNGTYLSMIAKSVKDKSSSDAKCYIESKVKGIISDEDFSVLVNECGYTDLLATISPNNHTEEFSSKSEIDSYYIDFLASKCNDYNNDKAYSNAINAMKDENSLSGMNQALSYLEDISGWKDADEKAAYCKQRISELKTAQEKQRLESARKAKKVKIVSAIAAAVVIVVVAFAVLCVNVIIPNVKYNNAMALLESGQYDEAYLAFEELGDFSDASEQLLEVRYQQACFYLEQERFEEAIDTFISLEAYNGSSEKVTESKYEYALWLMDNEDYDSAATQFRNLQGFQNSEELVNECRYREALSCMLEGNYERALSIFSLIDGYSDVDEQIKVCKYNQALEHIDNCDFENAFEIYHVIKDYNGLKDKLFSNCYDYALELYNQKHFLGAGTLFEMLDDYLDSKDLLIDCSYNYACELMLDGDYIQSYDILTDISDYKDSKEKMDELLSLSSCLRIRNVNVGDIIEFGNYEQDNNSTNGNEPIEWIVLDKKDNKILVLSTKSLTNRYYSSGSYDICNWATSSTKVFLNETFYTKAFNDAERAHIVSTTNSYARVDYESNPNSTLFLHVTNTDTNCQSVDKVFLLTSMDVNKYLKNSEYLLPQLTEYAKEKLDTIDGFLLRNIQTSTKYILRVKICYMDTSGNINSKELMDLDSSLSLGLRPAMWLSTDN